QLMEEKVWAKAVEDTVGLKAFFEANRDKYKWGERATATILSAANPTILNQAQEQLAQGRYLSVRHKQPDLTFDFGNATLSKATTAQLDQLAKTLQADTTLQLEMTGYIDSREATNRRNVTLANKRAEAVKAYLVEKEVNEEQVQVVASADKATNTRNNRRV